MVIKMNSEDLCNCGVEYKKIGSLLWCSGCKRHFEGEDVLKQMRAAKYRKALDILDEIEDLLKDDEGWESVFFETRDCIVDHADKAMKYNEVELRERGLGTDKKADGSSYRTLERWAKEREENVDQFINEDHRKVMFLLSNLEDALEENGYQTQRDFIILIIANKFHRGLIYQNTGKTVS